MATPEEIKIRIIARDETQKAMKSVRKEMNQTSNVAGKLKTAMGLIIGSQVIRRWYEVTKTFQTLRMTLNSVSNSTEEAAASWDQINSLVTELPVDLEQLTRAFIRMKALGIDPTSETIIAFTNVASAMGADLMQVTEAVADAITGEFERLKEFGIKTKSEGDRVSFTFRGLTTEIGKNSEEILQYLKSIGEVEFAGAATAQMDTVAGSVSNLGVAFDKFFNALEQNETITSLFSTAEYWVNSLTRTINAAKLEATLPVDVTTPGTMPGFRPAGANGYEIIGADPTFAHLDLTIESTKKAKKIIDEYRSSQRKNIQAAEQYNQFVSDLERIRRESNMSEEEFNAILDEQFQLYLKNTDQMDEYRNRVDEIARAAEQMAQRMEDAITDAVVNMGQGMTSFGDLAIGVLQSVYAEIVRAQIAKPIASAASGYLGNIFESFDLGSLFGMRAAGGPVAANRPYLVGERGPELFVPSGSGAISPNGAGQPVHITYNIQSWDSRDTMSAIQQSAPQIVGIVQNAFNKRGRRGPMG
jgi:hypothetical protein